MNKFQKLKQQRLEENKGRHLDSTIPKEKREMRNSASARYCPSPHLLSHQPTMDVDTDIRRFEEKILGAQKRIIEQRQMSTHLRKLKMSRFEQENMERREVHEEVDFQEKGEAIQKKIDRFKKAGQLKKQGETEKMFTYKEREEQNRIKVQNNRRTESKKTKQDVTKRLKNKEKARDQILRQKQEELEARLEEKHQREEEKKMAILKNLAKEK